MLKQNYVGIVDFRGAQWVRIGGTNLSQLTGVKGVHKLVLENVTGLQGTLDFRGIDLLEITNVDLSGVHTILCNTTFNIENLKKQKWNGLFVFDYTGPLKPNSKLISEWIQRDVKTK